MKRLEDIPKNNIFEAPEGYFDNLPGVIQARIAAESKTAPSPWTSYGLVLRYALPVLTIGIALVLIFRDTDPTGSPEELLATVSSEELSYYLIESDLSTNELLDNLDLIEVDIDALNEEIIGEDLDIELLEEYADDLLLEI